MVAHRKLTDRRQALPPPQFSVRTLTFLIALLCIYLALMQSLSPMGKLTFLLGSLAVLAHIAGNAVGTRLRASGDRSIESEDETSTQPVTMAPISARPGSFAPVTSLGRRKSLGRKAYLTTSIGALIGAAGGATLMGLFNQRASVASVILGASSTAVLGAMLGFALFSFCRVTFGAWHEAQQGVVTTHSPGLVSWFGWGKRKPKTESASSHLARNAST